MTIGVVVQDAEQQGRTIAAVGYLATPLVPIVVLAGEMRADRFLRRHAIQSLIWSGPFLVLLALAIVLMVVLVQSNFLWICLTPLLILLPFIPGAIWARKVYFQGDVRVPIIAQFVER